jgi:NAD(P)-dependent dehydrogenase (short-subunit alcohol dehydrogenase family)
MGWRYSKPCWAHLKQPKKSQIGVDLNGAFFCAQAAAREMVKSKTAGRIINVSSVHEDIAMPQMLPIAVPRGAYA